MIKTDHRPGQDEAVAKAKPYDGFAIYGEQRTGKTRIALYLVDEWKPRHVVIVCPKIAIVEWQKAIPYHLELDWECEFHIINFEAYIRNRHAWYKWGDKTDQIMLIVDEAHAIKKRGSKQSKACRTFARRCFKRLILTGTPVAQGIQDVWAQFDCILIPNPFGNYEAFQERYLRVMDLPRGDGETYQKIIGYKNLDEFWQIYNQYSWRITLNEQRERAGRKPIKVRKRRIRFKLQSKAQDLYNELDRELEADFNGHFVETANTMTLAMKQQQITGGWVKDADGEWIRTGFEKQDALMKLLAEPGLKYPVVIICRFIAEMDALYNVLINMKRVIRISGEHEWKGKFEADIAILQVQSGKAIDLAVGRSLIVYSGDYSYINFEQIRYRIRSFDTNEVHEYYLLADHTVDDLIHEAVTEKKDFATLICDTFRRRSTNDTSGNRA